ncbi:polygalacturonase-like [Impatiens glandulifera]|uniref:polygalacturonase-like n=1 Tax=Impatiens glandulifera TaxID=253017 RepID=UPI001FB16EF3|nr:polygalacturonase-like [Impatiens glandulifera]
MLPLSIFSILTFTILFTLASASATYNVVNFGARPDGKTDSTKAFLNAWASACSSAGQASIYVPLGNYLLASTTIFNGQTCKSNAITIRIDGTLLAPSDYRVLGNVKNWIIFQRVNGLSIYGGTLNAQGSALWACKATGKSCSTGVTSLEFSNSNNIFISGLASSNSQKFHIAINGCKNVKLQNLKVSAPANSPNTDGVHVSSSSGVTILNSRISTGDDCISVGPGTTNMWIEGTVCGPGHGISIGSLGKDMQEQGVQNITVTTTRFISTQNGFRIKTWAKPSNGFVKNVLFMHAIMDNVKNPIIIDQHYCDYRSNCPNQASGIKISDVTYEDIQGSSATQVAVKFDCSNKYPCSGIRLEDVALTYGGRNGITIKSSCANSIGSASGVVEPDSCL